MSPGRAGARSRRVGSGGIASDNFQEGVEELLAERGGSNGVVAGIRRDLALEVFPS